MSSTAIPIVYVVDDDEAFLTAASRLLRASGFKALTFPSAQAFLAMLPEEAPGCVVADLDMPEMNGLELQAALVQRRNSIPILFLTGRSNIVSCVTAMRDGAEDFIEKMAPKERLLDAISRALEKDVRQREARMRQGAVRARFDRLTAREVEVLRYVVRGLLNKQIAVVLGIQVRTVKVHRAAITAKMGVPSVAELTRLSIEAGIFELADSGRSDLSPILA